MLSWLKTLVATKEAQTPAGTSQIGQWMEEGFSCLQAGHTGRALELFDSVLRTQPDHADALYLSGVLASQAGRNEEAVNLISRAIARDGSIPSFHHTLGSLLFILGRRDASLDSYRRAVMLSPGDAQMQADLGCSLGRAGKYEDAAAHLRLAVQLDPVAAQAHYNLGTVLQSLNRFDDAAGHYAACLSLVPAHVDAANNLALLWHSEGRLAQAIDCLRGIVESRPDHAQSWGNLGCILQTNRQPEDAEACLRRAIDLEPGNFDFYSNLALVLREQGRVDESASVCRQALLIRDSLGERIRLATLVPVVARNVEDIPRWRAHFSEQIDGLLSRGGRIEDPLREISVCNFNLAFQPESNRDLQERTARLYLNLCPSLGYVAPPRKPTSATADQRIKVGFISKFFYNHIGIGRTTRGLIAHVDRDRFHVTALFVPPLVDDFTSGFIRDRADDYVLLPDTLEAARSRIAELELDILFYQDIGMESYTYFLAFSRLAPVQCVSFGFPDTTGIPNMDYWISSENFEQPGAAEHYSENLYLLRNIGTLAYYYRPRIEPPAKTRADFGLPEDRHLYICPQSLFKAHPDFDPVFAGILRGDPKAEIILIRGTILAWETILRSRFMEIMPDVADRIRFMPRLDQDVFLELIAVSDVMLDPFYFSGMNSSLEGLSVGVPVVTMPGALQRARHTYGMYRHMGIDDCIAETPEEYIDIALRLGVDREFRERVREKILASCPALYEDMHVVREFERFFVDAHARATRKD